MFGFSLKIKLRKIHSSAQHVFFFILKTFVVEIFVLSHFYQTLILNQTCLITKYLVVTADQSITTPFLFKQTFVGNSDMTSVKRNTLPTPAAARYVRIHPTAWNIDICIRAEFFGCEG